MKEKQPQLIDCSQWPDDKNYIIGDEEGLKNLIKARETSVKTGEYLGDDLGSYAGVKKKEYQWFENPVELGKARRASFRITMFLIIASILAFIGLGTVISWFL